MMKPDNLEGGSRARFAQLLEENNRLLRRQIREQNHIGWILYRGMIGGLGTAIGATLVVSMVVVILRPLQSIEPIRPAIEKLVERLDRLDRLGVNPTAKPGERMTPEIKLPLPDRKSE